LISPKRSQSLGNILSLNYWLWEAVSAIILPLRH
jgi:hypothetical protein